jgi:hypothetical protein
MLWCDATPPSQWAVYATAKSSQKCRLDSLYTVWAKCRPFQGLRECDFQCSSDSPVNDEINNPCERQNAEGYDGAEVKKHPHADDSVGS